MKENLSTKIEVEAEDDKPPGAGTLRETGSFLVTENGRPLYPSRYQRVIPPPLKKYYRANGHLFLIKSLHYEVVSDLDRCRQLWQEFSPYNNLFDTWDFRASFYHGYQPRLHFIVLKNGENLGLLPLQYEKDRGDRGKYFWFGSWWQEETTFFVKDPLYTPILLSLAPQPLLLNAISLDTVFWARDYLDFKMDDPKYILNLEGVNSLDDYLATFKRVKRKSLKRAKRDIEALHPEIIVNHFSDFDYLVQLSLDRFHQKGEDADWEDPRRVETFREVIRRGQKGNEYQVRMLTVKIGGRVAGVDLIALYKDCYLPLKCGYDVASFPGIGNFVNLYEVEDALSLGMKKMDFLEIGYGWKDQWFEALPLFKYEKG